MTVESVLFVVPEEAPELPPQAASKRTITSVSNRNVIGIPHFCLCVREQASDIIAP